jgi:hypothetical protein
VVVVAAFATARVVAGGEGFFVVTVVPEVWDAEAAGVLVAAVVPVDGPAFDESVYTTTGVVTAAMEVVVRRDGEVTADGDADETSEETAAAGCGVDLHPELTAMAATSAAAANTRAEDTARILMPVPTSHERRP